MHSRRPHRYVLAGVLMLAAVTLRSSGSGTAAQGQASATVTVDFATTRPVTSASGFLYSISPTAPPDAAVQPFSPKYWRITNYFGYSIPGLSQRIRSLAPGVTIDLLLSDNWCYPVDNWCGRGAPWLNWPAYEQLMRTLLQPLVGTQLPDVIEVWNEPDISIFWTGTRAQFFELYLRTYQVIRSVLGPNVRVGGPSFGVYDKAAIQDFLEYCLAAGCEVNSLIWHALDDTDGAIAAVPGRIQDARTSFLQNPRYAPLKIQRLDINEIVGPIYTHQPAGTLAHYEAFERGGADAAARGCWNDAAQMSECFTWTLDGLLTSGTFARRAVGWAHKFYADGVTSRVLSSWAGSGGVALASRSMGNVEAPQILIGHVNFDKTYTSTPGTLNVHLRMNHLDALPRFAGVSHVTTVIERIPAAGQAAVAGPVFVEQRSAAAIGGGVDLELPALGVGEVFRLTPCAFTLGPMPLVVTGRGGSRTVTITPSDARCTWSASSDAAWMSIGGSATGTGNGSVTVVIVPNNGGAREGTVTIGGRRLAVTQRGRTRDGDFDSDGKADIGVFRPASGSWFVLNSAAGGSTYRTVQWGATGDVPVPQDFDGDSAADIAVYRPSTGQWLILTSGTGYSARGYTWGTPGDVPVAGDYDGDGAADLAVYRPSNGAWFILRSDSAFTTFLTMTWGAPGDVPVAGDYDADGRIDPAVYRPATGSWFVLMSGAQYAPRVFAWGIAGDVPVAGDYDGDGGTDVAVFRPQSGVWFILRSSTGFLQYSSHQWGLASDVPVTRDFDGDGRHDLAVYRADAGTWFVLESASNFATWRSVVWGVATDVPLLANVLLVPPG